jgi:TolB-like protein/Flp pilus assembly protein TadD
VASTSPEPQRTGLLHRLRERGVVRVAASYAVIAWLVLQIADVTLEPLGAPPWAMTALIVAAAVGFPIAIALAWFLEVGSDGVHVDHAPAGVARPQARGLRHYADVIVIGVLVIAVAVLLVRQSDLGKPKPPANPAIAVLPFENLSGDPEQEYFAEGLAAEVLDRLGRVPGLTVTARSSAFSFKGKGLDARTIAGRLGVTTVLEGSVRRAGDRLRLSAQLVDGATGRQLWSGTFDRELRDVFETQEELAAAIIEAIVPAARGEAGGAKVVATTDVDAFDLYLLGRKAQEARIGPRLRESVGYLESAIAADPGFAKAHAALARSLYFWTIQPQVPPPPDALRRAEAAAHRAIALDPGSSEGHAALATLLREREPARAEAEYVRALEINPNDAAALWDYLVLLSRDPARRVESDRLLERYERIDPRSGILWQSKLNRASERNDGGAAYRAEFGQALQLLADDPDALSLLGRSARQNGFVAGAWRAQLQEERLGGHGHVWSATYPWFMTWDWERAGLVLEEFAHRGDDPEFTVQLQVELAGLTGDWEAWERHNARALELWPDDPATRRRMGFWLAVQGRYPEAAEALRQGEPWPEHMVAGGLGTSLFGRQLLPAVIRTWRATGRNAEADALVGKHLPALRADPGDHFDLAVVAASAGLHDEAVRALGRAFELRPVGSYFYPQLPWFRDLEGHPGYAQLRTEFERRVRETHAELLRIEAESAAAPGDTRGT